MAATKPPKPLTDDIPLSRAWTIGHRIYIRCGYHSQLNRDLRALGAHWGSQERALSFRPTPDQNQPYTVKWLYM